MQIFLSFLPQYGDKKTFQNVFSSHFEKFLVADGLTAFQEILVLCRLMFKKYCANSVTVVLEKENSISVWNFKGCH